MSHHDWQDTNFDWEGLNEAVHYIEDFVWKHSFCSIVVKEKYGNIRYEYLFPPTLLRSRLWYDSRLYDKWSEFGWNKLKNGVLKATEKWPHLKDEILADLAGNEALVGTEIHNKYWSNKNGVR